MESIEINQKLRIRPIQVPNYVFVLPAPEKPGHEPYKIALGDLGEAAINSLADQFRRDLLSNAIRQRTIRSKA